MRIPLKIGAQKLAIPYRSENHEASVNYGFMDLKADPTLIPLVPEVQDWPEFEVLLKAVNSSRSVFRSLGCEKSFSEHRDLSSPHLTTKLVSYIDIAFDDIALNTNMVMFEEMMGAYKSFAQDQEFDRFVKFDPELTETRFTKEGVSGWCISIWVAGFGTSEDEARRAWSTVILALTHFFSSGWTP